MQIARQVLSTAALCLVAAPSFATTTYTSSAAFLGSLGGGIYTETFDGLSNLDTGPYTFSGGGFSYTVSAPSSLYATGAFIESSLPDEALTITFNGSNITAVGGNFFVLNLSDAFASVAITLTLSDGTVTTFTPGSALDSFRGFTSALSISSLTVSAPGTSLYASLDNFTVGAVTAVPEPGSWALLATGLAALALARRRKA